MKKLLTFLLSLIPCFCSLGQQVSFIKYTVYDGLVANPVRCIYQDSKGFIWIGTWEGLSRFDGYKFTNYTNANGLSHNMINSMIDVNGELFVAENDGTIDIIQNSRIQKKITTTSPVNIINTYNNRLLVTTDTSGFVEYINDSLIVPKQDKVEKSLGDFISLGDSALLCASADDDLYIFKKDYTLLFSKKYFGTHFYTIFQDSKKRIWACTGSGLKLLQIVHDNKPSIQFAPLPAEFNFSPVRDVHVTSMSEEEDGSFWIGTMRGLVKIFPGGNSFVYNEKDGLPSSIVHTLYSDKEKNLWVGTSLGLAKWVSKNNVVFYNTDNKDFKNDVRGAFYYDNKKVLLSTNHGLQYFYIDTKEFKNIKGTNYAYSPVTGGPIPLIHYYDQVGVIDSNKNLVTPIQKLDTTMLSMPALKRHPDGTIFLGGFGGAVATEGSMVKKILPYRITGISINDNGDIWLGTWENGLFRIRITNNSSHRYNVKDFTSLIRQKQIRSMYTDKEKNIWVGTRYGGAFCLTEKSNEEFTIQHFNRRSGLMSDWVTCIAEKNDGDIWIGNYLGLDKLVKIPSGYRVFNFSKAVNFFAEIRSIIPIGDDNWLCTANTGVATFRDENLHKTMPLSPSVFSASLGVGDNKLTIFSPSERISLKPKQNAARFEFGALGFINERQILYSYRLKGSSDTSWSNPENIHEATYASLSPGHYTFEVRTIGWNGEYSSPASFSFFIRTPFWKQWWFIALGGLAIAGFFYAMYRYRINQLLRLQTVRNNIATDLHDDIGSSLTNISILSELSSKNISEPEKAQPFLQRISEEVQASSQAMDDIIWSVNSRNDSLQETMARMRRYAAELFDNSETNCHLELDEDSGNKKLSMEQRRDVYLIYKEALNNIHKHAHANNVWIEVNQKHNHLFMQIRDDGKGFNKDIVTHRNGLKNLRSRADKWNGKIKIQSDENIGTSIEIKMPLTD